MTFGGTSIRTCHGARQFSSSAVKRPGTPRPRERVTCAHRDSGRLLTPAYWATRAPTVSFFQKARSVGSACKLSFVMSWLGWLGLAGTHHRPCCHHRYQAEGYATRRPYPTDGSGTTRSLGAHRHLRLPRVSSTLRRLTHDRFDRPKEDGVAVRASCRMRFHLLRKRPDARMPCFLFDLPDRRVQFPHESWMMPRCPVGRYQSAVVPDGPSLPGVLVEPRP